MRTRVLAGRAFSPFQGHGVRTVDWSIWTPWRPVLASQRASCGEAWTLSDSPGWRLIHLNGDTAVILVEYAYVLIEIDTTLNPPRAYSLSVNERFAGCGSVMDNEVSISQSQL